MTNLCSLQIYIRFNSPVLPMLKRGKNKVLPYFDVICDLFLKSTHDNMESICKMSLMVTLSICMSYNRS